MKGTSFRDLRDLQRAQANGLVKIITPDEQVKQVVSESVGELSHMWTTRLEYAKALISAGAPDGEVMERAEALAVADHRTRVKACLDVFAIHGGKVPEGLKYAAHVVGVELPAQPTQPAEDDKMVNLHG